MPWLLKRPKDLFVLWHKYKFGVGGTKVAKLFTRRKRGANKCPFLRRAVFWRMVVSMVVRGHTSDLPINAIYGVYGRNLGVITILKAMQKDNKERGFHPNLK